MEALVDHTFAFPGPEADVLLRVDATTADVSWVVARGRIARRLREPGRDAVRVVVIAWASRALVVFDHGGTWWSAYSAPSVEAGEAAARSVLASGSAYNW